MKWHCTLQEDHIKLCSDLPDYNSERGPNPPSKMVNINQIPLPFSINLTTTLEVDIPKEMHKYEVWVVNPGAGLEKLQCSVQLAFTPEDENVRVVIVFRETSKNISDIEINCYHKSADVYRQ